MATRKETTPAQEAMRAALQRMRLDPEDYYDFEADEIIAFPPMPANLETKLTKIRRQTRQALDGLESFQQ